jgi:hypothetical protein
MSMNSHEMQQLHDWLIEEEPIYRGSLLEARLKLSIEVAILKERLADSLPPTLRWCIKHLGILS